MRQGWSLRRRACGYERNHSDDPNVGSGAIRSSEPLLAGLTDHVQLRAVTRLTEADNVWSAGREGGDSQ